MRDVWLRAAGLFALLSAACLGACQPIAAARPDAKVTFVHGRFEGPISGSVAHVVVAAQDVLHELDMTILVASQTPAEGLIIARTPGDQPLRIAVLSQAPHVVTLDIRVGVFGDRGMSQLIYDRIRETSRQQRQ